MADEQDDKDKKERDSRAQTSKPVESDAPGADEDGNEGAVRKGRVKWAWVLVLIVLVIAAGEGTFIWWYDQQLRKDFTQTREEVRADLSQLRQAQQSQRQQVQSQLQQLRQSHRRLQTNLKDLLERNQHLRKDWLVLEAEYLVKLANHRLQLEEDIDTAVVALEAADKRLKQTGDPGLIDIRKQIARDIQVLRDTPRTDVTGLSLKLSALHESIDNLPLATPDPRRLEGQQGGVTVDKEQIDQWTELPAAIWEDLKSLIVVRHHDQAVEPLLSPEQRFFLIENIRLQLEQARLALLGDEAAIYNQSLERAAQWIERYFDKQAAPVSNALQTIEELRNVKLDPELPDLSATYNSLQEYQKQVLQRMRQSNDDDAGDGARGRGAEQDAGAGAS